ncbi:adenylate/guanylate cyclase domain-containing protein [Arthrobacter deserti]|uniref:Adenylate/guanylate cyclase domain-containing protein n=1 Tax=Arthrobacter deserti TaxID=1742687 RepID=A0ABX1JNF2_9MICC|nr:adenylate/guanylate cyclase domain-containing protein [Arthrobacter deserti]
MTLSMPRITPREEAAAVREDPREDPRPEKVDRQAVRDLELRLLGAERTMKRREVAAAAGVSLLSARKLWRALGFANLGDDDVAFTPADTEALTTIINLVREERLTEGAAISITRSIGQMTDRMVVWQVEAVVEEMVHQLGITDAQARKRLVTALPNLIDPLERVLLYSYRRQLNATVSRLTVLAEAGLGVAAEEEEDGSLPLLRAVGFADLVSYTSLSRQMNEKTLAQLVQRFEHRCAETISVGGGRLGKPTGDEVLFIASSPQAGAEISLALAKAIGDDDLLPSARVAMVWGGILSRLRDIYGPTVNLASRLSALAEPGTVLVDSSTAATLAGDERFVLMPQKVRTVRGFGEIHPVTLAHGRGTGLVVD